MNHFFNHFKNNIGKLASEISPSPVGAWLNGTLVAVEENSVSVSFLVRAEMLNPLGIMHGGISAAIMDDVMGMACFILGKKEYFATMNLTIDYLRAAREGETIIAQAKVIRAGETVVHVACEILNAEQKIVSKGTCNMVKTKFTLKH